MNMVPVITYKDIFPGEMPSLDELLSDIPSELIVSLVSAMNAELRLSTDHAKSDLVILNFLLQRQDRSLEQFIISKLSNPYRKREGTAGIFAINYTMVLLQYALCNYNAIKIEDTSPQQELNIFKAYLVAVNIVDIRDQIGFEENPIGDVNFFYIRTWPIMVGQFEANTKVNPITEMVRGLTFLNFLKFETEYHLYVDSFLKSRDKQGIWNYILDILNIIQASWEPRSGGLFSGSQFSIGNSPDLESIFDSFSIDTDRYAGRFGNNGSDYTGIKSKPLLKVGSTYIVMNWNFLAAKLYEGLIFDFHGSSGISSVKKMQHITDFKRYLSEAVTEGYLFNKLLNKIFNKKHTVLKFDERESPGFPDAYYRKGNRVILFEIKDAFFPIAAINSTSYQTIREAIDQKYNTEGKGTGQFIKQINFLKNKAYESPQRYKSSKNLIIYPVMIYTDHLFKMPGINSYLQDEFSKKISKAELDSGFKQIKPLTFIDIRFFINFLNVLKDDRQNFFGLLDSYQDFIIRAKKKANRTIDLSPYFDIYQSFDSTVPLIHGDMFEKREDFVTIINETLNLTKGLPNERIS